MPALRVFPFGAFTKGVADGVNSEAIAPGLLLAAQNAFYRGVGQLAARPGTEVAVTLLDDQGAPQPVTHVLAADSFGDGGCAVAYSSTTQKVYFYTLDAAMTEATRRGVLWAGVPAAPDVSLAEGLGVCYIAHGAACDATGLYFPTRTWDGAAIADLTANLAGAGAQPVYFTQVIAYEQHLWGMGFGSGTTPATGYRPELARYSTPSFGAFQPADSITIGDRVRSAKERIIAAALAGAALILFGPGLVTRVIGYGRDSWVKAVVDRDFGIVGPRACCSAGSSAWYWSQRGPTKIGEGGPPEGYFDAIPGAIATVANTRTIVAAHDVARDQVLFFYETPATAGRARKCLAIDTQRDIFLGPASDVGIHVGCAALVDETRFTPTAPPGPAGPPSAPAVSAIGLSVATVAWTPATAGGVPAASHATTFDVDEAADYASAGPQAVTITGAAGVGAAGRLTLHPTGAADEEGNVFLAGFLAGGFDLAMTTVSMGQYGGFTFDWVDALNHKHISFDGANAYGVITAAGVDTIVGPVPCVFALGAAVALRAVRDAATGVVEVFLNGASQGSLGLGAVGGIRPIGFRIVSPGAGGDLVLDAASVSTGGVVGGAVPTGTTTVLRYRVVGAASWVDLPALPGTTASTQLTGLAFETYEWEVFHVRGGQESAHTAGPNFTTEDPASTALLPPSNLRLTATRPPSGSSVGSVSAAWSNSGESGVSTEVWVAGPYPDATPPAAGDYSLTARQGPGYASASFSAALGRWWVYVLHSASGRIDSAAAGPLSVVVNAASEAPHEPGDPI